jgi:Family of unknown function (DUF5767)
MSGHTVSISDMQNFVENLDDDIQISSNIGNVIELGGEDLGDDLGAGLLSNNRVSARPAGSSSSSSTQNISSLDPIPDISVNSFEPLEAISLDIPSGSQSSALPEISVTRESSSPSDLFSNQQTSTGPGIHLSAVPRLSPEEERKRKNELINKLNRLESKGYTLTKRFTMDNTLDEIQQEFDRLVDAKNLEASLRFQRQCLMGVVTGAEFLNSKFNPFDWELDGWSESVHENIEDFDEVFEELYDKYKGRGNMPPEAKLLMSLVGSGFMFHMSNSFFRSKMSNMTPDDIFRNNPQLAKQFAAAAAQQAGQGFGNFMGAAMGVPQGPPVAMPPQMPMNGSSPGAFYQSSNGMNTAPPMPQMPQNMAAASSMSGPRREMRGPSGVDDILKTFQEVRQAEVDISPVFIPSPGPVSSQQPAMQAVSEISSIHSTPMSEMSTDTTRTGSTVGQRSGRGRRKPAPPVANTMTLNL